jgi:hypothetical protein
LIGDALKRATFLIAFTLLTGLFAGCQSDSEAAAKDAAKTVDRQQQMVDRMARELSK